MLPATQAKHRLQQFQDRNLSTIKFITFSALVIIYVSQILQLGSRMSLGSVLLYRTNAPRRALSNRRQFSDRERYFRHEEIDGE